MSLWQSLWKTTKLKRRLFFLLCDLALLAGSIFLAFWIRFDGRIPTPYIEQLRLVIIFKFVLTLPFLALFGQYSFTWRFFGLADLIRLIGASGAATASLIMLIYLVDPGSLFMGFPRSVVLVDALLTLGLLGSLRIGKRAWLMLKRRRGRAGRDLIRVLIVGAGAAGTQICKEMLNNARSRYEPVGLIDDDPVKLGMFIERIKVVGTSRDLPEILKSDGIDEVLVAMPSASSEAIRRIIAAIRSASPNRRIKVLPGLLGMMEGTVSLADIKDVQLEDILGRDPVKIDFEEIRQMVAGRTVLVTGAGGSIGSELARTVLSFAPARLILVDIDETELFHLVHRFEASVVPVVPVIADVRDRTKVASVFAAHRPDIVLHAAAYKHVPILERFPEEAIKTNVKGTMILAEEAVRGGAAIFVNISTDKAINPTSVMGASKRTAEEILRVFNRRNGTKFVSVRFGNVIGSRGSVVPLFQEQIRRGGPVTVTDPEMMRYFMATSEAVLLVLEAAAGGRGGETFVLDMGKPVRIVDLAKDMITLSGKTPDVDVPIIFTGLRPGEKLFEEILGDKEETEPTTFEKIFVAKQKGPVDGEAMLARAAALIRWAEEGGAGEAYRGLLREIVPTYTPDSSAADMARW